MRRIMITAVALLGIGLFASPASARTTRSHSRSHVTSVSHHGKKSVKKHSHHGRHHRSSKSHHKHK